MAERTRFGKYELVKRLGRGGMGETFRAELVAAQGVTKQLVIKKMLPAVALEATLVEAFIDEARLSASLTHANLAQVFDFGEVEGEYFIAMEWVDGRSLDKALKRAAVLGRQRLPFPLSAYIVVKLLEGLQYAHTRVGPDGKPLDLVHRDITPDNVLLGFEGEVKLVDFGVAKTTRVGRKETEPGLVKGKFRYVSPEQAVAGPLDLRSDLFTVGVVLYQLLTGELPFAGQEYAVMQAIVDGRFVPPRAKAGDVPEPLDEVVRRAMQTKREHRFSSAREMLEPMSRWLYGQHPDFSPELMRELMGQLFDAELLTEGRLFDSHASARSKLSTLEPKPDREAVTQQHHAVDVATKPSHPKVDRDDGEGRKTPLWLVGLAALLGVGALSVVGYEIHAAHGDKAETIPGPVPVPVTPLPPLPSAAREPEVTDEAPGGPPMPEPAAPVPFEAESAPTSFTLTKAHQTVVHGRNCFEVQKGWQLVQQAGVDVMTVSPASPGRSIPSLGSTAKRGAAYGASSGGHRKLGLLALFTPLRGPAQLKAVSPEAGSPEAGRVCMFAATDRSLDSELSPGTMLLNGVAKSLARSLHRVELDDRFLVRALPAKKEWVVRISDTAPPWPVMFVSTVENGEQTYVLNKPELRLPDTKSLWVTVPVHMQAEYSRTVSIQLAPGHKLRESATDLLREAQAKIDEQNWPEASRVLDRCVNAYPASAKCHQLLGTVYLAMGYREEGRMHLNEFIRLAPKDPEAPKAREQLKK